MTQSADWQRRFGGIAKLYSESGLNKFKQSHVCVIGVGGVGSWAVVLKERIIEINTECQIHIIDDFVTVENVTDLIDDSIDYVIDCIDSSRVKAAVISYCRRRKIKIVTLGGAGGQIDPGRIQLSDLSKTKQDPLLSKTRKLLRQEYGFSSNLKRSFGVTAIYSDEPQRYATDDGGFSFDKPQGTDMTLSCAGGLGSCMMVTASFALRAVAEVLRKLAVKQR